jgi:hypothetical protein
MTEPNNPPTFKGSAEQYSVTGPTGMTLRDYFAGQALALLAADDTAHNLGDRMVAKWCYSLADAMIEARRHCGGSSRAGHVQGSAWHVNYFAAG